MSRYMNFDVPPEVLLEDTEALANAYAVGRGGNLVQLPYNAGILGIGIQDAQPEPLIAMQVGAENARTWTVTLTNFTKDRSVNGAPQAVAGIPLDNQTSGLTGSTGPGSSSIPFGAFCTMQYGTDAVLETVVFDYPWGGTTFQVSAATLRIYGPGMIYTGGGLQLPRLGAFVSGKAQSLASRGEHVGRLTFTSSVTTIGATNTIQVHAPRRAVAYRPFVRAFNVQAGNVNLNQFYTNPVTGAAVQLQMDTTGMSMDTVNNFGMQTPWIDLHPAATGVLLTNQDGANAHDLGIVWLLDVG